MSSDRPVRLSIRRLLAFLAVMGPGLITGSADNDAPGIATYSMVGSRYGYGFLWPIMVVGLCKVLIQEIAARTGAATGLGLSDLVRERFGVRVTLLVMTSLGIANLGTTTAQFAGIAASGELFGLPPLLVVPLAGIAVWLLVTRGSYSRVEKVLLLLTLYSAAYVVSAFLVRPPWTEVLRNALVPRWNSEPGYLLAVLATLGTSITPWGCAYLQASVADKGISMSDYGYTRLDVSFGAIFGSLVSAFISICTASTLHVAGVRVETARQAASALAPLAGPWATQLFGLGLFGASLMAASILPLATAYTICEAFGWEHGVDHRPGEAPMFYGIYTGMIVLSAFIVLLPGLPLFPLMWLSQVLNAALLPLILLFMILLASDTQRMKEWRNSPLTNVVAGTLGALVTVATVYVIAEALLRG